MDAFLMETKVRFKIVWDLNAVEAMVAAVAIKYSEIVSLSVTSKQHCSINNCQPTKIYDIEMAPI